MDEYDDDYLTFYANYPKHKAKFDGMKAWKQTVKVRPSLSELIRKVNLMKTTKEWSDKRYIPLPASWLRGRRWTDEIVDECKPIEKDVLSCIVE